MAHLMNDISLFNLWLKTSWHIIQTILRLNPAPQHQHAQCSKPRGISSLWELTLSISQDASLIAPIQIPVSPDLYISSSSNSFQ